MSKEILISNYIQSLNHSCNAILPESVLIEIKGQDGAFHYNDVLLEVFCAAYEIRSEKPDHSIATASIYDLTQLQKGLFQIIDQIREFQSDNEGCELVRKEGLYIQDRLPDFFSDGCAGISRAISIFDDVISSYLISDYSADRHSVFLGAVLSVKSNILKVLLALNEAIEKEKDMVINPLVSKIIEEEEHVKKVKEDLDQAAFEESVQREVCDRLGIPFASSLDGDLESIKIVGGWKRKK